MCDIMHQNFHKVIVIHNNNWIKFLLYLPFWDTLWSKVSPTEYHSLFVFRLSIFCPCLTPLFYFDNALTKVETRALAATKAKMVEKRNMIYHRLWVYLVVVCSKCSCVVLVWTRCPFLVNFCCEDHWHHRLSIRIWGKGIKGKFPSINQPSNN